MFCVFATITPKNEYFDDAKAAIQSILEETRNEVGCVQFDIHTNQESSVLYLYEQWTDEAALENHYNQSYTRQVFKSYEQWLAAPVDVKNFTLLDKAN
ncbi:MAG: antibiotic biosynthesis monooxygenase [Alteromonas sp.]|nr:antibiotic biosynthesis monooxygenase [Alteromonas sp.]